MLMRGNTAPVAPLIETTGYRPKSLDATLADIPCGPGGALARQAVAAPGTAADQPGPLVDRDRSSFARALPRREQSPLLGDAGLEGAPALATLYGAALWDLALGVALLARYRPVLVGALQLATMSAFTLIIAAFLPETWLHPFGPVTKNMPLALATLVMMTLED
jgi:DoxX-like family